MMTKKDKSLLIVEDSAAITERLLTLFSEIKRLDILLPVADGLTAYSRITKELPEIILLDIQLPGLTGVEILELINELNYSPHIIILTNNNNEYLKDKCLALGANEYYDKSTQFEEAVNSIKKMCDETD